VLREAVDLLGRIADHPEGLIQAIADGTFGITRRPPDGGRGLDGVVRLADDSYNPALELLEAVHA
jgi:beta-lysine 5,6-aminomutase alpha subunit